MGEVIMNFFIIKLMVIIALFCTLAISTSLHAKTFFDTDFETCTVGTGNDFPCEGWDDGGLENIAGAYHNKIEVINSLSFSGKKSLKGTFVNVDGGIQNPPLDHYYPATDHLFVRVATRQSPGFKIGSNSATKMIRFLMPEGYPIFLLMYYKGKDVNGQYETSGKYYMAVEGSYPRGTFFYPSSGVTPSQTSWDQIEIEIKLNTGVQPIKCYV